MPKMLKLKLNEDGNVVIQDGKPVYIYEDGKEAPFDANAAMAKISELNEESKGHRLLAGKLNESLERYKDKEGNFLDPDVALRAIETVQNFSDKEMFDSNQVESMKSQMNKAYTEKLDALTKSHKSEMESMSGSMSKKDAAIFKLLVKDRFNTSPFIMNKLLIPSEIAADYFGHHFKVEGEPENLRVIGYIGDEKILSRERPGTPADFEEAIETIVDNYKLKDRILKSSGPGAGSSGNLGNQNDGFRRGGDLDKLPPVERMKEFRKRQEAANRS